MSKRDTPQEDRADPMLAVVAMIGVVATGALFADWLFGDIPAWVLVLAIPGFLGSVAYFLSSSGIAGESRLATRAEE